MKIAILTYRPAGKRLKKPELELKRACKELGHKCRIVRAAKCQLVLDGRSPRVLYNNKRMSKIDVLIPRVGKKNLDYEIALIKQFQLMGVKVINEYSAITKAKNKVRSMQVLEHAGIPIPRTCMLVGKEYIDECIDKVGGTPLILKIPHGSVGKGVMIAESRRAVHSALDNFLGDGGIILMQEYIKESNGEDIRAYVVGDQVVAAMKRRARPGDFRSNLHRGGSGEAVEITDEIEDLALSAARAIELKICGVDLISTKNGLAVLEVNANPGFQISRVTKVDVAKEIIKYAIRVGSADAQKKKKVVVKKQIFKKGPMMMVPMFF